MDSIQAKGRIRHSNWETCGNARILRFWVRFVKARILATVKAKFSMIDTSKGHKYFWSVKKHLPSWNRGSSIPILLFVDYCLYCMYCCIKVYFVYLFRCVYINKYTCSCVFICDRLCLSCLSLSRVSSDSTKFHLSFRTGIKFPGFGLRKR